MSTIYAQYPIKGTSGGGGGGGTVTSVGITGNPILSITGSPITTAGTIDIELANESANTVLAGPTSGSPAPPTFRSLVNADLSSITSVPSITTLASLSLPGSQVTGNISGNAANITATSNSTLTTLSALSLPGAQVTGNIAGDAANISATSNNTLITLSALSLPGAQVTGNIAGTASNITATSNSTLTTLSALSLPGTQVTGNISGNAANVTGIVLPANGGTGIANNNSSTLTISGAFATTLTVSGTTGIILPTSGTLASLNDAQGSPLLANNGLSASVSGNALTINLTDITGATPSATSQVSIAFRDSTAATGTVHIRKASAATSITIPSGTTIGTQNGLQQWLNVYAMDSVGTIILAVSLSNFDEGSIQNSTAVSGGTASSVLYSTASQTGLAVRYIGRMSIKETTAGTWATGPTEISSIPDKQYTTVNFQSAGYNPVLSDDTIFVNANGGNVTITLPTAVGVLGKLFTVKKIDTNNTTKVSLATTSSQDIDGTTGDGLYTPYESLTVMSNGTNWYAINHIYPSNWTPYTPTVQGLGTLGASSMFYRRVGDSIEIMGTFTTGTVSAAQAQLSLPNGWSSDSNKVPSLRTCGIVNSGAAGANSYYTLIEQNVGFLTFGIQNASTVGIVEQPGNAIFFSATTYHISSCRVPIGGWFG